MMNSILNMFGGKNYGKLLLKTVSTDSNWYVDFHNSQSQDFDWAMVDNATKSVIATGRVERGVTNQVRVDLSTSSGDSSLYIDVDDTGNGVIDFLAWYTNKKIKCIDLDVLPNLKRIWLLNDVGIELTIKNDKGINLLTDAGYFANCTFTNIDFINNAKNTLLKLIIHTGSNRDLSSTPIQISQMPNLKYLRIHTNITDVFVLDSCNFKLNNPLLTYLYLSKIKDNDTLQNVTINDDTTYLYLNRFKYRITSLATQTLNSLNYLYLYSNKGDTYEYDQTAIIANLTGLKKVTFSGIRTTENVTIDNHTELIEYILSGTINCKTVILNNNSKLRTVNFNYLKGITDITITNNSVLNYLQFYSVYVDYNISIDATSQQNLTILQVRFDHKTGEWDFSDAVNLTSVNIHPANYTKFNLKNGNNANITTFSGHTNWNDATFLVDDPTLPIFTNATFRSGDVVTDDPTAY